jgi:hypothetical protein
MLGMANAYSIIIEIHWDVLYAKSTSTRLLEHRLFYANVKKIFEILECLVLTVCV